MQPRTMERALNPDLAKRIVSSNSQTGKDRLDEMSALKLVQITRGECGGKKTAKENQQKDITILDVYEDMASVKVVFTGWVHYLLMARFNGRACSTSWQNLQHRFAGLQILRIGR